jgi:hypothetical protein
MLRLDPWFGKGVWLEVSTGLSLMNCQGISATVFGRIYRADPVFYCPVASSAIYIVFFKNVL